MYMHDNDRLATTETTKSNLIPPTSLNEKVIRSWEIIMKFWQPSLFQWKTETISETMCWYD